MKIKLIVLFLLFLPFFVFPQTTIQGSVQDTTQNPLVDAQILLRDSINSQIIGYAITNDLGKYQLKILKYYGSAFLIAQSLGYAKKELRILIPAGEKVIRNFVLHATKIPLKEVEIKSKALPIEFKKDTVTYNVHNFTNGNESVVEDVLKKLPGIEVSENGKITYAGKPIEKVLIENDDLVGNNYKVLTKNLSSGIVKKVQVIENYLDDKNLKGIVNNSNKTVLNLQLQNNVKARPSGDIDISYGNKNYYSAGINLLGVNKKLKYYLLGTSNNIGVNSSPNDYISLTTNTDEVTSLPYQTTVGYVFPHLQTKRINFNHLYFGSSNLLINIGKKLKIRSNLYVTKDNNLFNKISQTDYLLNVSGFTINESQSLIRDPLIGEGFFGAKYNLTNHSDLDYKLKYRLAQTTYNGIRNTTESVFNEWLKNKEQYGYQNLNYIYRINKQSALSVQVQYLYNQKVQHYTLTPFTDSISFQLDPLSNGTTDLLQQNVIDEHRFHLGAKYMGVRSSSNYQLKIKYEHLQQSLSSNLYFGACLDTLNKVTYPYENDDRLRSQDVEMIFQNKNIWNQWNLLYGLSLHYKTFSYDGLIGSNLQVNSFYLSPFLGVKLKFGKSKLSLMYSSKRRFPSIVDLHSGYLLTTYRSFSKGANRGVEIKSQSFLMNYVYRDFGKLLTFYAMFIYSDQNKTFGPIILVNKQLTITKKTILPGNQNLIFSSMINKFIPFMLSTIQLNIQFSQINYFNYVNQLEQRKNNIFSGEYKLKLSSGWKKFFNFSIGIEYNYYRVRVENSTVSKTNDASTYLDLVMNLSKRLIVVIKNSQYFYNITSLNVNKCYFLDAKIKYTVHPSKFYVQLVGNNLLGTKAFNTTYVNDYMENTTRYYVLPQQFLLNITFRF